LCVAEVLGTQVAGDAALMAAGIDSLGATELQRALSDEFSAELPATLLFDHPSIMGIASLVIQAFHVPPPHVGESACY
jgi:acyl carrier protein